jgi:hypothetical protein
MGPIETIVLLTGTVGVVIWTLAVECGWWSE